MARLGIKKEKEKEQQIKTGYLICKTCNQKRELYLFNRQNKDNKTYYKDNKCKVCITGKIPKPNKNTLLGITKTPKTFTLKKNIRLSLEAKKFVKRLIMMKGYIDSVEAFKLVHYHINTFGYVDRLIIDVEKELTTMFIELLEVYKRDKIENNI